MKLQFKEQDFQLQAGKAIVDCFEGQPLKTNRLQSGLGPLYLIKTRFAMYTL
jgi:hypothetical protein